MLLQGSREHPPTHRTTPSGHHAAMRRRLLLVASAAALLASALATTARADGDPASDVLLSERVFLVVDTQTVPPYLRELLALTAEAARDRFPIRIAVIEESTDLGAVPMLFGRAQQYATFLAQELSFAYRGSVLVVMAGKPGGVALSGPGATPRAKAVAAKLAVPIAGTPEEFARIASTAVRQVAATRGIHLTTPRATGSSHGSSWLLYLLVGGAALVAAAVVAGVLLRRTR